MKERIKSIRQELGLSQEEFAKHLGFKSRGKIANIEFGKTEADQDFLRLICRTFNVNQTWLESGEGNMFLPLEDEEAAYVAELLGNDDNPLYDIIKDIMKIYLECDPKEQEFLKSFARSIKNNRKKESQD